MPEHKFPIGRDLTLAQLHDDPYPVFQELLAHEPVSWVPDLGVWLLTRREDVIAVLTDPETFALQSEHSLIAETLGPMMLSLDGPEHQRQRRPFAEPFQPRALREGFAGRIEQFAHELVDGFIADGRGDLDKLFSDRLALLSVTAVLGFPIEDLDLFRGWYDDFAVAIANFKREPALRERGKWAFGRFREYVLGVLDDLHHNPDHSVLSYLLHGGKHDLTESEIISNTAITFFGGLETTSAMFSNAIWALLTHPEQLARVQGEPGLLANAVEEVLRWESPVQTAHRHVIRPVTLHGVELRPGDTVHCMLGAANRDPRFYEAPDVFDVGRANADKHLSFARGPHFCFGAPLARLEATISLPILFERLTGLRLDPGRPAKPVGHEFRSPPTLMAVWEAVSG